LIQVASQVFISAVASFQRKLNLTYSLDLLLQSITFILYYFLLFKFSLCFLSFSNCLVNSFSSAKPFSFPNLYSFPSCMASISPPSFTRKPKGFHSLFNCSRFLYDFI